MSTTPIPSFVAQLLYHPELSPDSQDNLVLTCLVTWAVEEQGYELETEYVLDWDIINAYADSLISAYAPGTAQRRRSRLRTMTRIVNPSYVEPHALDPVEPDSTPQLYTPAEIEQIEVWMNYAVNAATKAILAADRALYLLRLRKCVGQRCYGATSRLWAAGTIDTKRHLLRQILRSLTEHLSLCR